MKTKKKIRTLPKERSNAHIEFILANIKDALFTILVPAYGRIEYDGIDDEDSEMNLDVIRAAGRLLASGKYFSCPECEKVLIVGSKSGYPFIHFHELLKELKRHGA